jgi:hypothetical protein
MLKIDPKGKHIHKNKQDHTQSYMYNMSVIVELHCGTWGRKERKRKYTTILLIEHQQYCNL